VVARRLAGLAVLLGSVLCALASPRVPAAAPPPAAAPRAANAPRVRCVPIAAFDSVALIGPEAWSPRGERLALGAASALYVYDAARPALRPRVVVRSDEKLIGFSWSPDGRWIAAVVGDPSPKGQTAVVAVNASGGTPVVMIRGKEVRPVSWGSDGRIYCWTGTRRHAMDPPPAWKRTVTMKLTAPPVLEVAEDLSLRLRHWAPQPGEEPILSGANLKSANGTRVTLLDHLPDGSRYLVGVSRDSASSWRVIDGDGRTISDLRARGITFQPTSLSGDGRLVAGFVGHWQGERGWSDTELRIADVSGAWVEPIAAPGSGRGPQLSRVGGLVAYSSATDGATRVGRLVFAPR
jgi:hypothetical protein